MLGSAAFCACFVLLFAAWLAATFAGRQARPAPTAAIVVASLAPPLLVASVMMAAIPAFGDLRVAFEGLRFRLPPGDPQTVTIGGSWKNDHMVVHGLPASMLSFTSKAGGVAVVLNPNPTTADPAEDLERPFAALRVDGARPFFNAVPLQPDSIVAFNDGQRLRFDPHRAALVEGASSAAQRYLVMPTRTSSFVSDRFQVPIGRELTAENATYPLRYYAAPAETGERRRAGGAQLGSFLCRDGGLLHRDFFLVLTGPEARVERSGQPPAVFKSLVTTIADGGSAHLALFRLDYQDPRAPVVVRQSRAQERRSLVARYRNGYLDLILDTPDIVRLPKGQLEGLRRRASAENDPLLLTLAAKDAETAPVLGQMLLRFPTVGAPLGSELFSRIEPPDGGTDLRVVTHAGARRYHLGDGFPVGENAAVLLRISRLDLPWGTVVLVFVLSVAAMLAGRSVRSRPLDLILLSGVEMLLGLRLLIAYQGAYLSPAAPSAVWESLGVLTAVPFIIQATLEFYERGRPRPTTVAHGLVAAAALAAVLSQIPTQPWVWLSLLMLPVAPALLGRFMLPWLDRMPFADTTGSRGRATAWLAIAAVSLVALRLLTLIGLGWKERMTFLPMAVSVYYTPWALLVFALLWARREQRGAFLWLWSLLGILYLALPALAHDWGTAFIFALPALLLFALPLAERPSWRAALLAAPLLATLVFHAVLPLIPALHLSPRVAGWTTDDLAHARADSTVATALLDRMTATNQNALRVWNLAAPAQLREVGTTEAESQVIVMETLRDYASQGAFGAGYLKVPLAPALAVTQLDDNLSAVHLLGTFGWVGSLLVLLLLLGWSLAPFGARTLPEGPPAEGISSRSAFGLLLVWTLLAAGMYMLSANTGLLLFTGKNVYFLAAGSLSDAAEGTLLVVLALWAFPIAKGASVV